MKLFLWQNVLCDGAAFALAENEDEARDLILHKYIKDQNYDSPTLQKDLKQIPVVIEDKFGFYIWGSD
jgi:hypothetical protein